MKTQCTLFLSLLFIWISGAGHEAMAFSCTSNGVSIGGTGTFNIPVDVVLDKTTDRIILTDMSSYTTCGGFKGYRDALKVTGASISSKLTSIGFTGFANIFNSTYSFPLGDYCVWPDASCSTNFTDGKNIPVNVQIGMQRTSYNNITGITIPAGTEIARFSVIQRSHSDWGWNKRWVFVLKNKLVIPAYTCSVSNPNQTVTLLPVRKAEIINNGAGKYPDATPFSINLSCEPDTTVSVKFEGATMPGKTDVLSNASSGNENIGIQMLFKNSPVVLGNTLRVVDNAQEQERMSFDAYYYYNGNSSIKAGDVTAVTTFTLTYQ